ncbi:hypothetical protein E2C01_053557 [Portunus trituberculatus]|uniref:Uncharacterized protein n=1 Tax=Portunus trituberculatus TaxID=210409 RepID=A0A5B7GSE9_PORTR|nr:hypothetical protein [Portunus trituberculatus]
MLTPLVLSHQLSTCPQPSPHHSPSATISPLTITIQNLSSATTHRHIYDGEVMLHNVQVRHSEVSLSPLQVAHETRPGAVVLLPSPHLPI